MRIVLCGFGVVAQSFAKLLESRSSDLYSRYGLKPRIVGVFDSKGCVYKNSGLDLKKLINAGSSITFPNGEKFIEYKGDYIRTEKVLG